jgi:hypothetical protein
MHRPAPSKGGRFGDAAKHCRSQFDDADEGCAWNTLATAPRTAECLAKANCYRIDGEGVADALSWADDSAHG